MSTVEEISFKLVKIESDIERSLNHQVEARMMLADVKDYLHGLDIKIINGDNDVKDEITEKINLVHERVSGIYVNVAIAFFGITAALLGGILIYFSTKT